MLKKVIQLEGNRVWLNLTNTQESLQAIGYVSGATNDYESAYDGEVSMEMLH
jgi:hypothetical protein